MKMRKLLAILMALMMVIGMFSVTAYAEEITEPDVYEETDAYVIYYTNKSGKYIGTYPTPYNVNLTYHVVGEESYKEYVGAIAMYNTTAAEDDQVMAVYCVDQYTGVKPQTYYERRNLEEAAFFTDEVAAQLRSIMINGFPNVGYETLGTAAGVEGLKYGEATLATQLAIWKTAYGEDMTIDDFLYVVKREDLAKYHSMYLVDTYNNLNEEACEAEYQAYVEMTEEEQTAAEQRVVDVFNYLTSLAPTAPQAQVVSASSFGDWTKSISENEDGTYTVNVTADVDVDMTDADAMALSLVLNDGTFASTALSADNDSYALSITTDSEDAAYGEVTLAIDGTQTASDIFLFAPKGNRNTAQSMIGLCDDQLPVHAEVSNSDRIVTIHKTDDTEERNGLENIVFDFYYVCSIDEYVNADVTLGTGIVEIDGKQYFSSPTADDIAAYVTGKTPVVSVVTDANGDASYNFGTDHDGVYLVVERDNPAIQTVAKPFFVAVPGGAEAGSDKCVIDIQPKNTVKGEDILIEKDVTSIDNEHDTYDVGENHTWIIQSSIPEGLGTGLKYEVSDELDTRLTLVSIDRVAIAADAGSYGNSEAVGYTSDENETPAFDDAEIVLDEGVHYTVIVAEDNSGFVMALTAEGMAYVAEQVGADYENYEIRTYFTAYINNTAGLGENIPNDAHVDYTNNVGTDYDADSDVPEVHTGGLKLIKTDAANGKLLSGATFTLNVLNEDGTYTPVEFYSDAAMTKKVAEITTDDNGEALFYGVAYGTYYLIETAAPEGYNLLTEPVEVVINGSSHLEENNVKVLNSAKFQLPETGGIGTMIFTLGGGSLFAAAGALLLDTRKKRR